MKLFRIFISYISGILILGSWSMSLAAGSPDVETHPAIMELKRCVLLLTDRVALLEEKVELLNSPAGVFTNEAEGNSKIRLWNVLSLGRNNVTEDGSAFLSIRIPAALARRFEKALEQTEATQARFMSAVIRAVWSESAIPLFGDEVLQSIRQNIMDAALTKRKSRRGPTTTFTIRVAPSIKELLSALEVSSGTSGMQTALMLETLEYILGIFNL